MTAQRSMTDFDLAARWDKKPFERNGERADMEHAVPDYEPGVFGKIIESSRWTYSPRAECIPSRDPLPNFGTVYLSRHPAGGFGVFKPRPEFARPPVNPILSAFRDEGNGQAEGWARWHCNPVNGATEEQAEFARAVLTRLATLQAVTS